MSLRARRICAALLALSALPVGSWATLAPHSFYTSFPLPGHHWVSALPAYNEHLTRDVGGLYLAMFAISLWAVLRPRLESFRLVGAGWLVFNVAHLAFHADHLDVYSNADALDNVVTLSAVVVLAAPLLWPVGRGVRADEQVNR